MTEAEKRMYRVCFTGHRPEKLTRSDRAIKKDLEREIRQAIADGQNVFITGMARGADIWAAEIVLKLRDAGQPSVPVPMMALSKGGVKSGRSNTELFWRQQIS